MAHVLDLEAHVLTLGLGLCVLDSNTANGSLLLDLGLMSSTG